MHCMPPRRDDVLGHGEVFEQGRRVAGLEQETSQEALVDLVWSHSSLKRPVRHHGLNKSKPLTHSTHDTCYTAYCYDHKALCPRMCARGAC